MLNSSVTPGALISTDTWRSGQFCYSDQDAANHDDNTPGSHGGPGVRLLKLKLSETRRINPAQTPARTVVFESLLRGSGGQTTEFP